MFGVLTRLKQFYRTPWTSRRSMNGTTVRIPHLRGHGGKNTSVHEDFLDAFLYKALETRPGAFVDVGVNLGQILLKVVTKSPGRQYVGFEPSVFCSVYLDNIIAANKLSNCQVFPLALSDKTGFLELFYSDEADEQATTVADFWGDHDARERVKRIACFRADDIIADLHLDRIGILKIDVEGGELEVLRGSEQVIRANRPLILIEILPHTAGDPAKFNELDRRASEMRKSRTETMMRFVDELGYTCRLVKADGTLSDQNAFVVDHYDPALANYALVPNEERELLAA